MSEGRVKELEDAIKDVVTQVADDLCWLDVYTKLAALVGIPFDPLMIPTERFLGNCKRYENSIRAACKYDKDDTSEIIKTLQARIVELEKEIAQVKKKSATDLKEVKDACWYGT